MSKQQIDDFLQESKVCRIATVTEDGAPYVIPVIYDWDGDSMYVIARKHSAWVKHIRREPRISVVTDEVPLPQRKVIFQGVAEIIGTDWVEMGKRILSKYLGQSVSESYLQGTLDQPRWVIRIRPTKITSWHNPPEYAKGKEAWHPRYYEPGSKWYEEHRKEKAGKRSP